MILFSQSTFTHTWNFKTPRQAFSLTDRRLKKQDYWENCSALSDSDNLSCDSLSCPILLPGKLFILTYCLSDLLFHRVECTGKTGVEMEALMGASIALLTVYDMCKAVSKDMVIADVHLVTKTGGKTEYKKP